LTFSFSHFVLRHGYWFLFVYVLAVGIGAPMPADPIFVLMGALSGNHQYSFFICLFLSIAGTLIGDVLWYALGRTRGRRVLGFLCKLSLEPDTCVRKTESRFSKRGAAALLVSKFVPGIGLLSVSLAGISRIRIGRFLLADAAGCALWSGSYLLLGVIFHRQLDKLLEWLGLFGRRAGLIAAALLAAYIATKYIQRAMFIRRLRVDRVTPQQARELLESGLPITVVDLRHPGDIERGGQKIAGALVLRPEDLRSRSHEIPDEHEIILYCT